MNKLVFVFAIIAIATTYADPKAKPGFLGGYAAAPLVAQSYHGYASPYVASPYVASPYVASPYVASPYAASPYFASPYVASPYAARVIGAPAVVV